PGDGQSAGRTRQFRHLHAEAELVALAVRAREGWRQWEERFERTLVGDEGALRAGANVDELERLRAAGVPAEAVDSDTASGLFPIAAPLHSMLLFDPRAGAIRASETIETLAGALGARLRRSDVTAVALAPGGSVQLETTEGPHRCEHCIVCAGAGTDRLVRPL